MTAPVFMDYSIHSVFLPYVSSCLPPNHSLFLFPAVSRACNFRRSHKLHSLQSPIFSSLPYITFLKILSFYKYERFNHCETNKLAEYSEAFHPNSIIFSDTMHMILIKSFV